MRALALLLCWPVLLAAVPTIDPAGVMNAASLLPSGLPGGGLAPGSQFVVRGRQIGPRTAAVSAKPVEELGGVSVRIVVGRHEWPAGLLEAGAGEIRGVVPPEAAAGPATVEVRYQGQVSAPFHTRVVPASVGIFTESGDGSGPAVGGVLNRGDDVTLRVTGLGARDGFPAPLEVFLGGTLVPSVRVVREVECCGIDTVAFRIPADALTGCDVPVQLRSGGSIPGNTASISIAPLGSYCYDVDRVRDALDVGGLVGFAIPFRLSMDHQTDPGQSVETVGDALVAGFRDGVAGKGTDRLFNPPPPGACTLYTAAGNLGDLEDGVRRGLLAGTVDRDGGDLQVWMGDGPRKTVRRQPVDPDYEYGLLGGATPDRLGGAGPLFLEPGDVSIAALGGADVSPFEIQVRFPQPIVWTNRTSTSVVNRGRDLDLEWTVGDPSQLVGVAGVSMDVPRKSVAAFLCIVPEGTSSFRVPAPILQSLPPTRGPLEDSIGYLVVGTLPAKGDLLFEVGGLAEMLGVGLSVDGRTVRYR